MRISWLVPLLTLPGAAEIRIAPEIMRATVMLSGEVDGTGVIFAIDGSCVWIATAAHVAGDTLSQKPRVQFGPNERTSTCDVLASSTVGGQQRFPDLAVVRCDCGNACSQMPHFDFLARASPRRGDAATVIGNLSAGWFSPTIPIAILGTREDDSSGFKEIDSANASGAALQGASGGPLLNERSELLGIFIKNPPNGAILAYAAGSVSAWIQSLPASLNIPQVQWKERSPAAPAVYPGRTEFALSSSSVRVSQLGWFAPAPSVRVARNLPGARTFLLAADLLFTGTLGDTAADETLRIAFPSVTLQWQAGSWIPWLRRSFLFGGVYGGVGIGFAAIDNDVNTAQYRIRSWASVYEAGLRTRLRGPWGAQFSYRHASLFERSIVNSYPRFTGLSVGVFLLLQ